MRKSMSPQAFTSPRQNKKDLMSTIQDKLMGHTASDSRRAIHDDLPVGDVRIQRLTKEGHKAVAVPLTAQSDRNLTFPHKMA
jgi:hypothetical protein